MAELNYLEAEGLPVIRTVVTVGNFQRCLIPFHQFIDSFQR
jgi:hypothetical protein